MKARRGAAGASAGAARKPRQAADAAARGAGRSPGRKPGRPPGSGGKGDGALGEPLAGTPEREASRHAIDLFCDALWLEHGLSKNTLDAYRRDLTLFAQWLPPTPQAGPDVVS
ncbi:site-specific integrase, partial [Burkholderia sp. A1]|uniref:site-specific integrase n=1 Tax=Burkholderia sp. A1 TaxID=148446 RepID=UPI001F55C154